MARAYFAGLKIRVEWLGGRGGVFMGVDRSANSGAVYSIIHENRMSRDPGIRAMGVFF